MCANEWKRRGSQQWSASVPAQWHGYFGSWQSRWIPHDIYRPHFCLKAHNSYTHACEFCAHFSSQPSEWVTLGWRRQYSGAAPDLLRGRNDKPPIHPPTPALLFLPIHISSQRFALHQSVLFAWDAFHGQLTLGNWGRFHWVLTGLRRTHRPGKRSGTLTFAKLPTAARSKESCRVRLPAGAGRKSRSICLVTGLASVENFVILICRAAG